MHRDEPRPADAVPSSVARARLSGELRREVAELEVRMSEAALRSDALREAGHSAAAAQVVDEQRALLAGFEERVDAALSRAVVEREAERVIADEWAREHRPEREAALAAPRLSTSVAAVVAALVMAAALWVAEDPTTDLFHTGSTGLPDTGRTGEATPGHRSDASLDRPALAAGDATPWLSQRQDAGGMPDALVPDPDETTLLDGLLDAVKVDVEPADGTVDALTGGVIDGVVATSREVEATDTSDGADTGESSGPSGPDEDGEADGEHETDQEADDATEEESDTREADTRTNGTPSTTTDDSGGSSDTEDTPTPLDTSAGDGTDDPSPAAVPHEIG